MEHGIGFIVSALHRHHPHLNGAPFHMADTLLSTTPRRLLVDGRDPFADEVITVSDPSILAVAAPDGNGQVFVTGLADGISTITVAPGAEDVNRLAGSDDVTVVTPTPLAVTLE